MEEVPALAKYVRRYDYVVAKDGSGDFFTVQEAVNAAVGGGKKQYLYLSVREYMKSMFLCRNHRSNRIGETDRG